MAVPLVLDVDTGTDDAIAIMLAALHPDLRLEAVTTVNGNVPVDVCTENSLRVLDHIGRHQIPVYEGCAEPIARPDFPFARSLRGESGIHGRYLDLPCAVTKKQGEAAASFLVRHFDRAERAGTETVLVATGPLTNVAMALKLDPGFKSKVRRLVIMGGGHEASNVTASAEFNIWADPEAARTVLTSGIAEIVLVTLDATHKALVSRGDCEQMRSIGTPAGAASAAIIEGRIRAYEATQPMERAETAPVHDALCVAFLADASVISIEKHPVDVETFGELTIGRTVIDTRRRGSQDANVWVAFGADETRFVRIMLEAFAAAPDDQGRPPAADS